MYDIQSNRTMPNKSQERFQVERFLKTYSVDYKSLETINDEPPDFILETNANRKISIEHTRLFKEEGEKIKPEIDTLDDIVKDAQVMYEELDKSSCSVYIRFQNPIYGDKSLKQSISKQLCQAVLKNKPTLSGNALYCENNVDPEELPEHIESITIKVNKKFTRSLWQRPGLFISGPITPDLIMRRIEIKNKILKSTNYGHSSDECWLLLVVEGKEWSEFSYYKPNSLVIPDAVIFDKIFIFGVFGNELETLKK